MDRNEIKEIVRETVKEMLRNDLVKTNDYQEASAVLAEHYQIAKREDVAAALQKLGKDPYISILPLYFGKGYTIEELAEKFDCETSTISRNKKRLCLAVFKLL